MFANEGVIHKYKQVQLAKSVCETDKHARLNIRVYQNPQQPEALTAKFEYTKM